MLFRPNHDVCGHTVIREVVVCTLFSECLCISAVSADAIEREGHLGAHPYRQEGREVHADGTFLFRNIC